MIKLAELIPNRKLIKEANQPSIHIPPKMYHGTIESRANRIWKVGLEPVKTRNYEWSEKGIYLTTDASVAKHFGNAGNEPPEDAQGHSTNRSMFRFRPGGEKIIILTVSTKGLDPRKFKQDPHAMNSLIYFGVIPAKNVVDYKEVEDTNLYEKTSKPLFQNFGMVVTTPNGLSRWVK